MDPTRLWFELMPRLTPMPPPPTGTLPDASFLPVMGGYDAGYYGYVWSRVFAWASPRERSPTGGSPRPC